MVTLLQSRAEICEAEASAAVYGQHWKRTSHSIFYDMITNNTCRNVLFIIAIKFKSSKIKITHCG
jgi:hypothetical protein